MTPPIPIIILNWNGLEDTRECIDSLERQTYQDYIIYLVDNGSNPKEVEALQMLYAQHPKIQLHFNPDNLGFTRGNNVVLRELLTREKDLPFVVLLNNDTQVSPQWLAQLVKTAEQQQADMVASKMINYYERSRMDNAGHQMLNTLEILPLGNEEPITVFNAPLENMGPCAGAALYTTAMLRDIGLFDEHFQNGYEDVELGLRGIICGYRSVYAPQAVVYHKVSRSVNKIRDFEYTLSIQRHVYYIIAKLIPTGAFLACLPFFLFRTLAAFGINSLFFRRKFLRIQYHAIRWVFTDGWRELRQNRKEFFSRHQAISSRKLIGKMDFFLKKDIQRFYKYLIRGEKMVFEKYD